MIQMHEQHARYIAGDWSFKLVQKLEDLIEFLQELLVPFKNKNN
jgi:hypothetical protein